MNLYKKCTAKPYPFLVIGATLASDRPSRFRKNLLERIQKLIMTIDDEIRDEEPQFDINREAAKIPALSSEKIDKNEHLTGEEILPPDQSTLEFRINGTTCLLIIPFFATSPILFSILHLLILEPPLSFQTPRLLIHAHSRQR